jgi:hypothetical protein
MKRGEVQAIASTLLAAVDLRKRLAFRMFQVDNPNGSEADFEAASASPYYAYADAVIGELVDRPAEAA